MIRVLLLCALGLSTTLLSLVGDDGVSAKKTKAKPITKSATVGQNSDGGEADGFLITDPASPFAFAQARKFRRLDSIAIRLTIFEGSTGSGDTDESELSLALDGIDTGILLNGFADNDQFVTATNSGRPKNAAQILAALKADGELAATIIDASPGDNSIDLPTGFDATLVLKGKKARK